MTIFRKVALERLSSPEQLDQLMQVTNPQGWLALTGLSALLLAALLWGVFGSIPTEAVGEGILLRQGGVTDVASAAAGQVQEVLISVGDNVEKNQPLATIHQESLSRQIRDADAKEAALEAELRALKRSAEEQRRLRQRDLAQQRANLEQTIATLGRTVALAEERSAAQGKLLADGLVTHQSAIDAEQQLNTARDQLATARLDRNGLELKDVAAQQQLDQQLATKEAALRDLASQIREDRAKLAETIEVVSPFSGRVLELLVDRGAVVNPGSPIASLELTSDNLVAVLFVPAADGKRIHPGMAAKVSPSTVKREEFGYLKGRVLRTSAFPTTARAMNHLLGNEALTAKLMKEGPPIQVDVALEKSSLTPTGFLWSSSRGPDVKISSGTLSSGSIVIREDRPLRLVIPKVREKLGF